MSLTTKSADVLILECDWGEDLIDAKSTKPLVEGWAAGEGITTVYRSYHDGRDLVHWLRQAFQSRRRPRAVYVAGHGCGRFLHAPFRPSDIDFRRVLATAARRTPISHGCRGILLGACEIGRDLEGLLKAADGRLDWVAGYNREVPWVESTISDLLFLQYAVVGRRKLAFGGKSRGCTGLKSVRTCSAEKAARWLLQDFPLANELGFCAMDRR